jgi:CRISPR-associated protein Csx17
MVNRWDFVLAFEGALLFASGAARRMGSSSAPQAAMPYMVLRSTSGSRAAAEDENDKGELWAPIWTRAASAAEVSRLIGEGRADWRGRVAVDGLDMARAVASLGVDRGVDSFERYSFVERYGQAMLAVPQGRVTVAGRARPEVTVLGQLDNWLGSVRRRTSAPQGVRSLVRRVEAAQFVVTEHGGPAQVIDVLASAAELDAAVARSGGLRADVGPSPLLDAADWLPHLDDGSVEFRFALAVASQADPSGSSLPAAPLEYLRPVQRKGWRLEWSEAPALVPGLGSMPLVGVLSQMIERRAIDVGRSSLDGQQSEVGQMGVQPGWRWGIGAPTSVMHAMAAGELDDRQVERALRGLLLLRFTGSTFSPTTLREDRFTLVPALRLLVPFVSPLKSQESVGGRAPALRPGAGWWRQLGAGQVREVLTDAVRRLQIAGHTPRVNNVAAMAAGVDGPRLAASLAARSDSVARVQSLSAVVLTADEPEQEDRGREAINTTQEQEA